MGLDLFQARASRAAWAVDARFPMDKWKDRQFTGRKAIHKEVCDVARMS